MNWYRWFVVTKEGHIKDVNSLYVPLNPTTEKGFDSVISAENALKAWKKKNKPNVPESVALIKVY